MTKQKLHHTSYSEYLSKLTLYHIVIQVIYQLTRLYYLPIKSFCVSIFDKLIIFINVYLTKI